MIADRYYYVNSRRTRIVDRDDPDAGFLLAAPGEDISTEDVKRYGLDKPKAKQAEPEPEPAETKAVEAAPENKAMKPAGKK